MPSQEVFPQFPLGEAQKLRRTDSNTFGVEKQQDKRWGSQPVQSKIVLKRKRLTLSSPNDDDDDVDDK